MIVQTKDQTARAWKTLCAGVPAEVALDFARDQVKVHGRAVRVLMEARSGRRALYASDLGGVLVRERDGRVL